MHTQPFNRDEGPDFISFCTGFVVHEMIFYGPHYTFCITDELPHTLISQLDWYAQLNYHTIVQMQLEGKFPSMQYFIARRRVIPQFSR